MKPAASKVIIIVVLALSSSLLASAAAVPSQTAPHAKRLPYDSPTDAVEAVRQIEEAVALDPDRRLLLRPYEETVVNNLLDALRSPFDEVKAAALDLLALAVKQLDVPKGVLQTIVPAVSAVEERYRMASSAEEVRLAELARRVLWHARVKAIPADRQRLQFLQSQIENREDGYYYPFEALEYIVAMGTEDARVVLDTKLSESKQRSISDKLLRQIRMSNREIEIQIDLSRSDEIAQASRLKEAFFTSREDRSFTGQSFRVWLIRQMASRHLEGTTGFLSQISRDETLEPSVRYEAEQTVRQLKGLDPPSTTPAALID